MKNKGVTQRKFEVGDLVIVCKQVKSNTAAGIAAKIVFKAKGPYRVIKPDGPVSHKIQ